MVRTKLERLDDTFKLILTIVTIMISVSLGIHKERFMLEAWILYFVAWYAFSICLWCVGHLANGEYEYLFKFSAWYLLLWVMLTIFPVLFLGFQMSLFILLINVILLYSLSFLTFLWIKNELSSAHQKLIPWLIIALIIALVIGIFVGMSFSR